MENLRIFKGSKEGIARECLKFLKRVFEERFDFILRRKIRLDGKGGDFDPLFVRCGTNGSRNHRELNLSVQIANFRSAAIIAYIHSLIDRAGELGINHSADITVYLPP